jgi:hypothetical protein
MYAILTIKRTARRPPRDEEGPRPEQTPIDRGKEGRKEPTLSTLEESEMKMNTTYHFNGQIFHSYADLCNAYRKAKGYWPLKAYKQEGCRLYYA